MKLEGKARQLVTGKNFAALSTIMSDGSPHTSIVWIDLDNEEVVFNTAIGRLKERNIKRDPRVSLAIWNAENPYEQICVRGKVTAMTTEGADAMINRLTKKYMGIDKFPYNQPGEVRVTVRVAPMKVTSLA